MNINIRKLMEQCVFSDQVPYPTQEEIFERFAHLIVEDLVMLVENHAQQYHQPTWAFEIVEDIKEQFGVDL